jgi:phosphatidylglycerol---prolipoprotein diacylglyceryl transferase
MNNWLYFYQHLPFYINPTAFSLGFFSLDWYSLAYIFGFTIVYFLLRYRIKKGENKINFNIAKLFDLLFFLFVGLLLGGRLGYVLFYNLSYYLHNPITIISPFDPATHAFVGIYGMSYHGGLIGILLFAWIFSRKNKINFYKLSNFVVPAVPAGYFLGRLGNFFNGELYGRETQRFWGMYFPSDPFGVLRHPSQIYEAILEGIVVFLILWIIRNNNKFEDKLIGIYMFSYGFFRIIIEFFRQPDSQIGYIFNFLTLGQIFSFIMVIIGVILIVYSNKIKKVLE